MALIFPHQFALTGWFLTSLFFLNMPTNIIISQILIFVTSHFCICHFRNEKGTGAKVRPAIVSGILTSGGSRPSDKGRGEGGRGGGWSKNKGGGPPGLLPWIGYWLLGKEQSRKRNYFGPVSFSFLERLITKKSGNYSFKFLQELHVYRSFEKLNQTIV